MLQEFESALENWQGALSGIIQEGIQRLSLKTVHPRLHLSDDIGELEENLDYLLDEINETGLFAEPLDHKMLTVPKRQRFLEGVIEQLENTQRAMDEFGVFYDWHRNWLGLSESGRKLIRALVKVKPSSWESAMESWYFHHCLNLAHSPRLPEVDAGLGALVEAYRTLQPMLSDAIRQLWESRRTEAVHRLKTENKSLYQLLLNRKPGAEPPQSAEIRERWGRGLSFVSEVLPVLLVGDSAIPFLPAIEQKAFDYILIDEGQFLNEAQLARLRTFGHRVLVVSNPELEALPGAGQWPQAWRGAGVPAMSLQFIHHWNPGNLSQLDVNRTLASSAVQNGHPVFFEQIKGTFDEANRINLPEAKALINLLGKIEKTPQRTLPTVGIACLTMEQRDLVQQLLFLEKKQDQEGADTIRQLERNGLGVFFVDELIGQHFDILILSGTFGLASGEESLTEYLQQIDSQEWLSRLDLLMGRAHHGVFVLNSIPADQLESMAGQNDHVGQFIYANYLLYLQAMKQDDFKKQEKISNRFLSLHRKENTESPSVFPEQVVQELRLYLRDQKLLTDEQAAHLSLPILVSNTETGGKRQIVVQPDGFFGKTPATDYIWEYDQRQELSDLGYTFLPTWSVKWWKETSLEAKRLAGNLINLLEEKN